MMTTIKEYTKDGNGVYTAMTWSQSKDFKTLRGAEKWLNKYL